MRRQFCARAPFLRSFCFPLVRLKEQLAGLKLCFSCFFFFFPPFYLSSRPPIMIQLRPFP